MTKEREYTYKTGFNINGTQYVIVEEVKDDDETYLSFSEAITALKEDKIVQRKGWNGKKMFLRVAHPNQCCGSTVPYIEILTPNHESGKIHRIPWVASQSDIMASDWSVINLVDDALPK